MKVVSIKDIEGTERDVHCPHKGFRSLRIVLERDGVGFSMHKTIIPCGETQHWHYTRHMDMLLHCRPRRTPQSGDSGAVFHRARYRVHSGFS